MILDALDCCNIFQTSGTDWQQLRITEFKLLYNAQQLRVRSSLYVAEALCWHLRPGFRIGLLGMLSSSNY